MSETVEEDDDKQPSPKKGKKTEERAPDKSTPIVLDEGFIRWITHLFRDDERADVLFVKQLLGRDGKHEGAVIKTHPFRTGKAPTREEIVALSNELLEEMKNEADNHRKPRMFAVVAVNPKRGGEFARRTITVEPSRLKAQHEHEEYDEDNPLYGHGGDRLLKRVETVLADGRWHSEQQAQTFGGFAQLLTDENKELRGMVKDLMTSWIDMAKQKNEADNNHLDRELAREKAKFDLEIRRQGVTTLTNWLLPEAARVGKSLMTSTPAPASVPTQAPPAERAPESIMLQKVIDGLPNEAKDHLFGKWTDNGIRLEPGILSESQVRILAGVCKQELHPDWLNQLLQGHNQITTAQGAAIMSQPYFEQIKPLLKEMQERKAKLESSQQATTTTTAQPANGV